MAHHQYLESAAACVKLAARTEEPDKKLKYIEMASCWIKMAQQVQRENLLASMDRIPPPSDRVDIQ